MPYGVCAWLLKRGGEWILYIADEVLSQLGGVLPGCEPLSITPRWRLS
ncbi:hypothetical protein ACFVV7_33655 [Streptomyces globisporus]